MWSRHQVEKFFQISLKGVWEAQLLFGEVLNAALDILPGVPFERCAKFFVHRKLMQSHTQNSNFLSP